jgi:hypothetical protein
MKIIITETQLDLLIEQDVTKKDCISTADTQWNGVDTTIYDIMNSDHVLHYGDKNVEPDSAIKVIQRKLGVNDDGHYGKTMIRRLAKKLNIDICKQIDNDIPIGPKGLKELGLNITIPTDTNGHENYILASTLVGENMLGVNDELFAILSTIKQRAIKCGHTMEKAVLKPKQYSTWNHYNKLNDEKKSMELFNRVTNQNTKGFDRMLKVVKEFNKTKPLKLNHYVNPDIVDLIKGTRPIEVSYRNNKTTAKEIGDHTFWWDSKHSC